MEKLKVALVAHDKKKIDMVIFVKEHLDVLLKCDLYATNTTGVVLEDKLKIRLTNCFLARLGATFK
jgi:methylglyoxal synthase